RCKTVIEPLVSKQWFVKVDGEKYSLKKKTLELIKSGKVEVYPENFKKILIQWLGNLQDWCISRQIWWGPQFPVWYRGEETYVGLEAPKGNDWIQDENTFDTWFSSGQWPYTTLGYPKGKDYKNFYPTDTMITGRDLLFFWAARMLMLGRYRTGKTPFRNLYFTGLVRDKEGHKFSKSRGNGIDPLEIIEKFGADALRLSLVMDIAPGQDSRLFEEKIESFRNFVTKLWNIFRYCEQSDAEFALVEKISKRDLKTLADKWIVSQLEGVVKKVSEHMKDKNISLAQDALRKFTWDSFADWYLEINKLEKNSKVLGYVLDRILKLWHPFTPFVTEEIYGILNSDGNVLMMAKWPKSEKKFIDAKAQADFSDLQDLVAKIRNIRANYHIDPTELLDGYANADIGKEIVGKLARVRIGAGEGKKNMVQVSTRLRTLRLDIAKSIDVEREIALIRKEIVNLENLIAKNEGMLKNKKFIIGAPAGIILSAKNRLEEYREKIKIQKELEKNLSRL
ncbi:MAG: class I tRNA ligase family protein, partial [bacterium]|nr:class I tRNA ligase family protein [bacterium]